MAIEPGRSNERGDLNETGAAAGGGLCSCNDSFPYAQLFAVVIPDGHEGPSGTTKWARLGIAFPPVARN
jgi:hypothetical protein